MTALSICLLLQLARQRSDIKELLKQIRKDRDRMVPAVHALVELVSEIANAAARSGENEYLLAKRLDLILSSSRGEGKIIKQHFFALADLHEAGVLTYLEQIAPELSRSEIGLCGMIILGLEPPCISRVFGYDHVQTFYNKRTEIRKKLYLEKDASLEGYLNGLVDQLKLRNDLYFRHLENKY